METPICVLSSWKDAQNSKSWISECFWPMQVIAPSLSLASLWLISCPESPILMISPFHALLESEAIPCQGISAPLIVSGKQALSPSPHTPWRRGPWKATERSLPDMCSVWSLPVSCARNGLKPSGQQQKQRSWTSFHANDLSVASCASLCSCLPGPRGLQNLGLDFNSSSLICLTDCQPRTSPCLWRRP